MDSVTITVNEAIDDVLVTVVNEIGGANLSATYGASTVTINSDTGVPAVLAAATDTLAGVFTAANKVKLDGIATAATANSTDATLLARANHTGTQSADTIVDGTTNKAFLGTERTKLAAISGTNTGDQTISISGDVTAAGSSGALTATVTKINGTTLSSLATGILKNTTSTGVPTIAVVGTDYLAPTSSGAGLADLPSNTALYPTLNQNTTGTAANVTGIVLGANGGTGVDNTGKAITLGGNLTTSGAFATTLTATGATSVTLPTTGTLATTSQVIGMKNRLINGAFNINQAGLTTAADAVYHLDQWYALTETGSVTIAQQTNQENGQPTSLRMTQPDVGAKRIGSAQPIESINCRDLRGQTVALCARVRCSASQAIRWAVIEWTGTADAITKDVVNTWSSGTFTTGNFFISTTTTISATGSVTPAANTWTDLLASATISSSANNLIVFIWSEGTLAQNATLDIGLVQLAQGAQTPFEAARPVGLELALAQRYYQKSYDLGTAPGTVVSGIQFIASGTGGEAAPTILNPVPMRTTPSVVIYSPFDGAVGFHRNYTAAANFAMTGFNVLSSVHHSGSSTSHTSGQIYGYHFTKSARL